MFYYLVNVLNSEVSPGPITCAASSQESPAFTCDNVYDGVTFGDSSNEWASNGENNNLWINITLPTKARVHMVTLWPRCLVGDQFSRILFEFSDGFQDEVSRQYTTV